MRRVRDLMAADIMEMTDEEIRAEVIADGEDPDEIAARMRRNINDLLAKAKGNTDG